MAYVGNSPVSGDNTFRILDDISSYTQTFDGSSSSVVSVADDTFTFYEHRFITGQRFTYSTTGSTVGGLTSGTAYYIIKNDQNTIKVATSYANALIGTAINISALGTGTTHTINVAFDGINTKFKATYTNGTKALITRAAQLQLSINGVIQQPQDTASPTTGFGFDVDSTIVFSVAPLVSDVFWGNVIATSFPTFDIADNDIDTFTGTGALTNFTLSKIPANNQNILVTIDGVVQYPSEAGITRAYSLQDSVLVFSSAPVNGTDIQVRHIGFAGATSSSVTGFYGRTGNVGLTTTDNIVVGSLVVSAGVLTATSFSGDGSALTGVGIGSSGSINTTGIITATSFSGDGSNLTGVSGFSSALSSTQGSLLNTIFKTPKSFTIGAGTSVNIESDAGSGNIAFTRLNSIIVSSGSTLRVATGTTFIMNVLNIF